MNSNFCFFYNNLNKSFLAIAQLFNYMCLMFLLYLCILYIIEFGIKSRLNLFVLISLTLFPTISLFSSFIYRIPGSAELRGISLMLAGVIGPIIFLYIIKKSSEFSWVKYIMTITIFSNILKMMGKVLDTITVIPDIIFYPVILFLGLIVLFKSNTSDTQKIFQLYLILIFIAGVNTFL